MKKLNRKGFTLIELLAVIVIMSIILVVTVPYIFTAVADAKVSSIHNLAKTSAKSYNDIAANDLIAADKVLTSTNINMTVTSVWQCMTYGLAGKLGISTSDVVLAEDTGVSGYNDITSAITTSTCSSIKLNNGAAEILLVAKEGGKFYDAEKYVYALSSASNGDSNPVTVTE